MKKNKNYKLFYSLEGYHYYKINIHTVSLFLILKIYIIKDNSGFIFGVGGNEHGRGQIADETI